MGSRCQELLLYNLRLVFADFRNDPGAWPLDAPRSCPSRGSLVMLQDGLPSFCTEARLLEACTVCLLLLVTGEDKHGPEPHTCNPAPVHPSRMTRHSPYCHSGCDTPQERAAGAQLGKQAGSLRYGGQGPKLYCIPSREIRSCTSDAETLTAPTCVHVKLWVYFVLQPPGVQFRPQPAVCHPSFQGPGSGPAPSQSLGSLLRTPEGLHPSPCPRGAGAEVL